MCVRYDYESTAAAASWWTFPRLKVVAAKEFKKLSEPRLSSHFTSARKRNLWFELWKCRIEGKCIRFCFFCDDGICNWNQLRRGLEGNLHEEFVEGKTFLETIFDFENHEEISSSVQSTFRCNPRFDVAFEFVVSLSLKSCWACDFLTVSIDPAMCKTWRSLAFFYAFNIFWASDFLFFAWNSHFCVLFFAFFSSFYSRLSVGVFEEQWTWWESHEAE